MTTEMKEEDETKRECVGRMAVHMLKGQGDDVILDLNGEIGKIQDCPKQAK